MRRDCSSRSHSLRSSFSCGSSCRGGNGDNRRVKRALLLLVFLASAARAEPPNAIVLVAKPGLADPNFSETVVLVTRTPDSQTVGVILNRPTERRHEKTTE